jgi:23S rRNA pseudouridine955/2504/2580 synthase
MAVRSDGREAVTHYRIEERLRRHTLLRVRLETGRTHQIRVHLAHLGFPVAGDDKYGDFDANKRLAKLSLKRMFLHAASVEFRHPRSGETVRVQAPLAPELDSFLRSLKAGGY